MDSTYAEVSASPSRELRNRHRACASLLGLMLLFAGVLTGGVRTAAAAEDARPRGRSYQDGPLTLDDYRAKPPDDSPLSAFTVTDIRCDYRYRYQSTNRTTTAYVTEMTIDAVVIASQSWNRHPKDKRVLDHEQGHFDLAMIAALQTRLRFAEEYQTRKLTGTGATMEIALEDLKRELKQEVRSPGTAVGRAQRIRPRHAARPGPHGASRSTEIATRDPPEADGRPQKAGGQACAMSGLRPAYLTAGAATLSTTSIPDHWPRQ